MIFINDGSTDHTEEIIKKYKEEFDLHNIGLTYLFQENEGQAAALNNGLKYVLHMCIVMEKLNLLRTK